ncbi:MAG: bifunctional oligoribonuclease/PAP phosphatase NrnA [Candidatus Cloacimonadota bacterium]|nr:bifunctional oligoribonuclease/PAP phosphatase NrnA [Candidatus Cloacimonadota bacterium]
MTLDEFKTELKNLIYTNQNFVITTHENPDGDAIGAQFAIYLFLKRHGKSIRIINQDLPPNKYDFLGLSDKVETQIPDANNQIVFMLDYNERKRAGKKIQNVLNNYQQLVCIDHHTKPEKVPNAIFYIDTNVSSACEIIYLLLKEEIKYFSSPWKRKFANCLYTGLIYDTNNFANKNVSHQTFTVASELLAIGADNNLCSLNIFENRSTDELKLLGNTLSTLKFHKTGRNVSIAFYITTQKMLKGCNADMELTDGFSKEVKPSNGRDVVIYFRELNTDNYRVSLRSKDLNVQKIAEKFGGGGHKLAAGFETKIELEMLKNKLFELINHEGK